MWIGTCRESNACPLGIKWCKQAKALGIYFTYNENDYLQSNFYDKLKTIRPQIRLWSWRGLSLHGKATIIKCLLLPKMMYVFSVLPTTDDFIKQLNTIIYNFLLKGPDKIARVAARNEEKCGGLNLKDVGIQIQSLRLARISRLFNDSLHPWKAYINFLLKNFGGKFIFRCNYDIKDLNIDSAFYKELLQWRAEFRSEFSTQPPTAEYVIWNNKNIKVDGKSVHYYNYVNAGIIKCSHLFFHKSNLESYECA